MIGVHRFRAFIGVATVAGLAAFAVHAAAQTAPPQGRYTSWAPPAVATATQEPVRYCRSPAPRRWQTPARSEA